MNVASGCVEKATTMSREAGAGKDAEFRAAEALETQGP